MEFGSLAVAMVHRQVMVVQVARTHTYRDAFIDVHIFTRFGDRIFLASTVPQARILSSDILAIFPASDAVEVPAPGMLRLPPKAFSEYMELNNRMQEKYERLFEQWAC